MGEKKKKITNVRHQKIVFIIRSYIQDLSRRRHRVLKIRLNRSRRHQKTSSSATLKDCVLNERGQYLSINVNWLMMKRTFFIKITRSNSWTISTASSSSRPFTLHIVQQINCQPLAQTDFYRRSLALDGTLRKSRTRPNGIVFFIFLDDFKRIGQSD